MKLVIVESPSKAKSINKYLGADYKVIASYGHIRQLPSKTGSVDPNNKFNMTWEETAQGKKRLKEITTYVKQAKEIYLATDPDREGEAISWHIVSYLEGKKILTKKIPVYRVVFNSITQENILKAFQNTRQIDENLVSAYLARLSLDYLVGFGISPILWRKLPGSRSAGRVQSVALKIICEREKEIEEFKKQEYWDIEATLECNNALVIAKLITYNNKELNKLDIQTKEEAEEIRNNILNKTFTLSNIENKELKKSPFAPFTTSTLQQDAFNKLGFSTKKTMTLAQKLYEGVKIGAENVGLITYMRTDATQIDPAFITQMRNYIKQQFSEQYLYKSVRIYKTKAKNAQEAHEAIRPTDIKKAPEKIKQYLEEDAYKLYELIYKRTLASQMSNAEYEVVNYEFIYKNNTLKAIGSVLKFNGFYKIYKVDDNKDLERQLPKLEINSSAVSSTVSTKQHFTEPPARYSEATLVKKLEEIGIGRPSTYANIITTLQDREYIKIDKKRFYPEDRGLILNIFLNNFFSKYVEYTFTANLEQNLDLVSSGEVSWLTVLENFWKDFNANIKSVSNIPNIEVIEKINANSIEQFVGSNTNCPECKNGLLQIKTSKYGPFIGCSNYPTCNHTQQIQQNKANDANTEPSTNNKILGSHNNYNILLKKGPYGYYVEEQSAPPKRTSIPQNIKVEDVDLNKALSLLQLPKDLGEGISIAIGKFGPYIKQNKNFYSLKEDIFSVTLAQAKQIIQQQQLKKEGKLLGVYPATNNQIILKSGKYGIYLQYNNKNIKIPKKKDNTFDTLTLQKSIDIINNYKEE